MRTPFTGVGTAIVTPFTPTLSLDEDSVQMRDVFQHRIAQGAGEKCVRVGHIRAVGFGENIVNTARPGFVDGPRPRVETDIQLAVKGQLGEMPVAAANIEGRRGQVKILVKTRFYRTQKRAEIRQVAGMEKKEIFLLLFRHFLGQLSC